MRRSPAALALTLVAALLLAGCGGGGQSASSTTSPTTAVTTTAAPSTTTVPSTTAPPTTAGPAFVVGTPTLVPPDPLPGSGGANGSGCAPETGALPDGVWFGKLLEVTPDLAGFDPLCFYFGDAAVAAAAEDGITELPSPHYLRNPLPDLIDVETTPGAPVYSIDNSTDTLGFITLSLDEWPAQNGGYTICPGEGCSVWLYVNGGRVTEIMEQYLP